MGKEQKDLVPILGSRSSGLCAGALQPEAIQLVDAFASTAARRRCSASEPRLTTATLLARVGAPLVVAVLLRARSSGRANPSQRFERMMTPLFRCA